MHADPETALPRGQHQTRLAVDGALNGAGRFEILAITAGEGNGWLFGEDALRTSLALWDGVECFVDHAAVARAHSLRDLAGVVTNPEWDAERRGVRCELRAIGPSAELLSELGREMVAGAGQAAPRVGFSADVVFTAQGRQVEKILRVLSVDLVFNPARGGAFIKEALSRAASAATPLKGNMEENSMTEETDKPLETEAQTVREQMCGYLLESGLAAARLPAPVTERVRKQFTGRVFEPGELNDAIEDARKLVSELTAGRAVQGLKAGTTQAGRLSGMVTSEEQFTAALYDLLGADRPEGLRGVRTARLSGIRELYTLMTGDVDFTGGYDGQRAQFATTADLPAVLKNAMNKLIVQEWEELGRSGYRWWEPVVDVQHFNSLQQITGILVGEVTVLPVVNEGGAYTQLNLKDSAETGDWTKYGGYVGLTLEMFERDETHRLRQYPRKLASAALRRISALVGSIFTANAGIGPAMADGYNVFEAAHHANLGTTALSSTSWEGASAAIYNQPMLVGAAGTAPKQAVDAKYLIVPRAMRLAGWQLLYPSFGHEANFFSENMQRGEQGDVITCPEFADANDWAAVADPRLAPAIILGERFGVQPEIVIASDQQQGALFTNDEMRMKVRHWVSVFVADYRPLYKANVP